MYNYNTQRKAQGRTVDKNFSSVLANWECITWRLGRQQRTGEKQRRANDSLKEWPIAPKQLCTPFYRPKTTRSDYTTSKTNSKLWVASSCRVLEMFLKDSNTDWGLLNLITSNLLWRLNWDYFVFCSCVRSSASVYVSCRCGCLIVPLLCCRTAQVLDPN